ncbi:MAG: hypothetical protein WCG83_04570 [Candidatus Peregrinibacteria bacterium]
MSPIHPHWQTTDGDAQGKKAQAVPVRIMEESLPASVRSPTTITPPAHPKRSLSRQPAAITGILLAASIGFAVFAGSDGLPFQNTKNSSLAKKTPVESAADTKGSTFAEALRAALPSTDSATSSSSPTEDPAASIADIPIGSGSADPFAAPPANQQSSSVTGSAVLQKTSAANTGTPESSASITNNAQVPKQKTANTQLPTNPYTVGTAKANTGKSTSAGAKTATKETLHSGAPIRSVQPLREPSTGPTEWVVVFAAAGALLIVVRKQMRRIAD